MTLDHHAHSHEENHTLTMVTNGTPVALVDAAEVVEAVTRRVSGNGYVPLALGSVNLDHIHHFRGTPGCANSVDVARADLDWVFLADGAPIVSKAEKLTGQPWSRVTGADLLPQIIDAAAANGHSVGFLGGTSRMQERLRFTLRRSHPDLEVGGFWSPERADLVDPDQCARLASQISAAAVDILVVVLGKPLQELWISRYGTATGARVLLAFGAATDFLAGEARRAPQFFQDNGLEWFYRLVSEPRRLSRRYLLEGPRALIQLRNAHIEIAIDSPLIDRSEIATSNERSLLGGMP